MEINTREIRKKRGQYYTPQKITKLITKYSISDYILTIFKNKYRTIEELFGSSNPADLNKLKNIINTIKILDPACGEGAFLIQAAQILLELFIGCQDLLNQDRNVIEHQVNIIQNNLFGVDLIPETIKKCKKSLKNWLQDESVEIKYNLKVGNSLIGPFDNHSLVIIQEDWEPFYWKEEFNEVFKNGGFDIILENPPYIYTRGANFTPPEKHYFHNFVSNLGLIQLEKGREIQSGKLNTYSLFVIRSLQLLKSGGKLAAIIPNNFLRSTNLDIYRKYLLEKNTIAKIVDLSSGYFKGITASLICLIINKKIPNESTSIEIISNLENLSQKLNESYKRKQFEFLKNKSFIINTALKPLGIEICSEIKEDSISLGEICKYIIEGIVCSKKRDIIETKEKTIDKPFLEGKNISRYFIKWAGKFVRYERKNLHRARPEDVFSQKKIMIQRISGGIKPIKASYDPGIYYSFSSINNLQIKDDLQEIYPLKYILLILNSNLINWFYAKNFSNNSELTVNISKTYLEEIPIVKSQDISIFIVIAEYLQFLFQYYQIEKEKSIFKDDLINFFYNISNGIIYELYFRQNLKVKLIEVLKEKIKPIKFDDWYKMKLKKMVFPTQSNDLLNIEKRNRDIINKSFKELLKDNSVNNLLREINNHEWVKFVEGG